MMLNTAGYKRNTETLKDSRIINNPNNDDLVLLKSKEIQLMNEINSIKSEMKFLAEINIRINKELIYYQAKLGILPGEIDLFDIKIRNDDVTKILNQLRDSDFLLPLLSAYDDKINILENTVPRIKKEKEYLYKVTNGTEEIVQDNNYLRQQLEKKSQQLVDILNMGNVYTEKTAPLFKIEKEEINQKMKLLVDENNMINERLKDQDIKITKLNRNLDEKNNEISELSIKLADTLKQKKELEFEIVDLRKAKELLDIKLRKSCEDSNRLEIDQEQNTSKMNKLETENKIVKSQLFALKKEQTESDEKKNKEIETLNRELEAFRIKEREINNKFILMERDYDYSNQENKRLKNELESLKNNLDDAIRKSEVLEANVQFLQKKEESLQALTKQQRENLDEALTEKDRALNKLEGCQRTLSQLSESHKEELETLKNQHEKLMDNLKARHRNALDSKDNEIKAYNEENLKTIQEYEKSQKEVKRLKNELNRVNATLNAMNDNSKVDQSNEIGLKMNGLLLENDSDDKIRELIQEKEVLQSACNQYRQSFDEFKHRIETLKNENAYLVSENESLKLKFASTKRENHDFMDEIKKIKKNYENKSRLYSSDDDYFKSRIKELVSKLEEYHRKEKVTREKTMEALRTHEKIEDKLRKEVERCKDYYEKIIADLKYNNNTNNLNGSMSFK